MLSNVKMWIEDMREDQEKLTHDLERRWRGPFGRMMNMAFGYCILDSLVRFKTWIFTRA